MAVYSESKRAKVSIVEYNIYLWRNGLPMLAFTRTYSHVHTLISADMPRARKTSPRSVKLLLEREQLARSMHLCCADFVLRTVVDGIAIHIPVQVSIHQDIFLDRPLVSESLSWKF